MDSWWNLIKKGHNQYLKNQHEGVKNSDEDHEENSEEDEVPAFKIVKRQDFKDFQLNETKQNLISSDEQIKNENVFGSPTNIGKGILNVHSFSQDMPLSYRVK